MGCCYSLYINNELKKQTNETPFFDLKGNTYYVKVVEVYDGDTCYIVMRFNKKFLKFKVRALGYDSPEMKPLKSDPNRDKIIKMAYKSRDFFISKLTNINNYQDLSKKEVNNLLKKNTKIIKMKCHGFDKYGRLLGEFFEDNISINQEMINKSYGIPYDGGTKKSFEFN